MRSRIQRPGATRRNAVAVACLVAVASLLLSTPSSSAPGDPAPGTDGLPEAAISGSHGVVTNSQGAVVRRSKMYITIGPDNPIWGALYVSTFNNPVEAPVEYRALCNTRQRTPCISNPFHQPECATDDPVTQRKGLYFRSELYPVTPSKAGGRGEVGLLAKVRVNLVAFGSIPASATLTMRAPRVNGKTRPLVAHVWQSNPLVPNQAGCDPSFEAPQVDTLVAGQVEITLSDLTVDGQPVDLGPACRTEKPLDLFLWGDVAKGGYTPGGGGILGAYDGLHGGSLQPLNSPYYYEDNGQTIPASTGVTVPPFVGCGVGAEDMSPLVTAMASGPNNPVVASQDALVATEVGPIQLDNLAACNAEQPDNCPLPAPAKPERPEIPEGDE